MTILRERVVTGKRRKRAQTFGLTAEQQANTRAAMRALHVHMSWAELATLLVCSPKAIDKALSERGTVSPGLALHIARIAQVPVEDVLSGAFPKAGHCPRCGWACPSTLDAPSKRG